MGWWEDHREEEIKAVSRGSFISCFELHGAPFLCVVLLTTTSKHVWFCLLFPKCRNSLDNGMLPFGLTRCTSLLRTTLKALLDATYWAPCSSMCSGDLLGWKGHWASADASLSSHQLNGHSGCFLTSHLLAPVKWHIAFLIAIGLFCVWKNMLVICWVMLWFSWRVWLMESSYLLQF